MKIGTNPEYIASVIEGLEHTGGIVMSIDANRNRGIAMVIRLLEEIRDEMRQPSETAWVERRKR